MNTYNDDRDATSRHRRFSHAGNAVGLRGELTDGLRRRIMAALRLSSLYVAFGRRSRLGALGAGRGGGDGDVRGGGIAGARAGLCIGSNCLFQRWSRWNVSNSSRYCCKFDYVHGHKRIL